MNRQKYILLLLFLIFLFGFITSFWVASCPVFHPPSWEQLENCTTPFCEVVKKSNSLAGSNESLFIRIVRLSFSIFTGNIKATTNALTALHYFGFAPIINVWGNSRNIGALFKCDIYTGRFFGIFFPHGWLELISMFLIFSLYYSLFFNFGLIIIGKMKASGEMFKSVFKQVAAILIIDFLAAFLESIAFLAKH